MVEPHTDLQDTLVEIVADGAGLRVPLVLDLFMALVIETLVEEPNTLSTPGGGWMRRKRVHVDLGDERIEQRMTRATLFVRDLAARPTPESKDRRTRLPHRAQDC
ncbi:MAG: hypothetical protein R2855_09740 [Thermomicrobiales bacterium]